MDSMKAFAMGQANQGKELRVFDWHKAARLVRDNPRSTVVAGLAADMEYTAGTIAVNGDPVHDEYTYLASNWACPVCVVDDEEHECFVMDSETEWGKDTKWPESALAILSGDSTEGG